jgi:ubiquinone/menaquinone biosynthesis C-methylase UbiE
VRSLLWLIVLGGVVGWLWRRRHWPCPPWLVPLLENPYVEAVAGAVLLLERADVAPGMRVLDAGCGPGRLTLPAAARVGPDGRVLAVDLEPRMLERLRERLAAADVHNVETLVAGLGDGKLPAAAFDVAFLVTVLGEISEPAAALREIHRALRPGGVLAVTEVLPDPHYQPVARVRALAADAGFVEQRYFPGLVSFTLQLVKGGAGAAAPGPAR